MLASFSFLLLQKVGKTKETKDFIEHLYYFIKQILQYLLNSYSLANPRCRFNPLAKSQMTIQAPHSNCFMGRHETTLQEDGHSCSRFRVSFKFLLCIFFLICCHIYLSFSPSTLLHITFNPSNREAYLSQPNDASRFAVESTQPFFLRFEVPQVRLFSFVYFSEICLNVNRIRTKKSMLHPFFFNSELSIINDCLLTDL